MNSIKPLVSIVTASFNSIKTIERTIKSILNQSYNNIEYVIIDGSSTDGTVELIESYQAQFAIRGIAYRWLSEPDNGLYDAMNKGIKLASGEYIGIIGSDDWYELDAMELVANSIKLNQDADLVYGAIKFYRGDVAICLEQIYADDLPKRAINHPGVIYRKGLHNSYGYYSTKYKIASDYEFLLMCYLHKCQFVALDKLVANFSLGGASSKHSAIAVVESARIRYTKGVISSKMYYALRIKALLLWLATKML